MGSWYTIGVLLGGGIGIGLLLAGLLASTTRGMVLALVLAVAVTAAFVLAFDEVGAAAAQLLLHHLRAGPSRVRRSRHLSSERSPANVVG